MDLLNVDVDLAVGPLLDIRLQFVDFRTLAADNNSRTRRIDRDAKLVRHPLDFDIAHTGVGELLQQVPLEFQIFMKQAAVVALGEPARTPRLGHTEPESVWMCLLTHLFLLSK